jgi:hypothetical protein
MPHGHRWSTTARILSLLMALGGLAPLACSTPEAPDITPADSGVSEADGGTSDAGSSDAGSSDDAGLPEDAGSGLDAGRTEDAGRADGGRPDAGAGEDAGSSDAGCPPGDVRGRSGNCQSACLLCETSADCPSGKTCEVGAAGCTSCVSQTGGTCSEHACTAQSDCCPGQSCQSPNDPPQCGICIMNPHECDAQTPCDGGLVCNTVPPVGCSSCDPEPPTECLAPCTTGSCSAGMQCNSAGACVAIPCSDGYACAAYEVCQPDAGDTHGCAFVSCTDDAECRVGVCVKGLCAPTPGTCSYPVP